jgi:hypothetical protein
MIIRILLTDVTHPTRKINNLRKIEFSQFIDFYKS